MKTQTTTNLFFITAASLMLSACGGGFGNGGLTLSSGGVNAAQTGNEFANYSSTVGSAGDSDSHSPSSSDVLSLISAPATEAEAFAAVDGSHSKNMRTVAIFATGAESLNTFDNLTSTGPAADSPYGGVGPVNPNPVNPNPVDPISNPPTGVDNPDTLPTLQSSAAKKGAAGDRMVELLKAGRGSIQASFPPDVRMALAAEAQAAADALQKLNMTNLSAETQSLVQANILTFNAMVSVLK